MRAGAGSGTLDTGTLGALVAISLLKRPGTAKGTLVASLPSHRRPGTGKGALVAVPSHKRPGTGRGPLVA
eukprot:1043030-Pelagomonas_calceolata.AAC.1